MHFDDSRPIWQQLVAEFRDLIITEKWLSGSKIPSTRELALQYQVNPNTVQRALAELDRLGYSRVERAAGRTLVISPAGVAQLRQELACEVIKAAAVKLRQVGITEEDAIAILKEQWQHD